MLQTTRLLGQIRLNLSLLTLWEFGTAWSYSRVLEGGQTRGELEATGSDVCSQIVVEGSARHTCVESMFGLPQELEQHSWKYFLFH